MSLAKLISDIEAFHPFNSQEEADKDVILNALKNDPQVLERSSLAHLACSIWTLDPSFENTLAVFHNIYGSWSWIGGHADGNAKLEEVALRELAEETGAQGTLVGSGAEAIVSLDVLTVDGHEKRGSYVSSHLHLNVTYLAIADASAPIRCKEDENSAVAWMPCQELLDRSTEPWIRDRVYRKIVDRVRRMHSAAESHCWDAEGKS